MTDRNARNERSPERRQAEGVRIIGAEEAQKALEAGQVAGRRPEDELRFGDVPPAPSGPRPPHRFPLPDSVDPAEAVPRPPIAPLRGESPQATRLQRAEERAALAGRVDTDGAAGPGPTDDVAGGGDPGDVAAGSSPTGPLPRQLDSVWAASDEGVTSTGDAAPVVGSEDVEATGPRQTVYQAVAALARGAQAPSRAYLRWAPEASLAGGAAPSADDDPAEPAYPLVSGPESVSGADTAYPQVSTYAGDEAYGVGAERAWERDYGAAPAYRAESATGDDGDAPTTAGDRATGGDGAPAGRSASWNLGERESPWAPGSEEAGGADAAASALDEGWDTAATWVPAAAGAEGDVAYGDTDAEAGYDEASNDQPGYAEAGYAEASNDQPGYAEAGYDQAGYDQAGYDQAGYDEGRTSAVAPTGSTYVEASTNAGRSASPEASPEASTGASTGGSASTDGGRHEADTGYAADAGYEADAREAATYDETGSGLWSDAAPPADVPDLAPPEEGITVTGSHVLPHWTEPSEGVPSSLIGAGREEGDSGAWNALGAGGARWRDGHDDWDDESASATGFFADEEDQGPRLGVLDNDRSDRSDLYSFDEAFQQLEEERSGVHPVVDLADAETQVDEPVSAGATARGSTGRRMASIGSRVRTRPSPGAQPPRPPTSRRSPSPGGGGGGGGSQDLASRIGVGVGFVVLLVIAYAVGATALLVLAAAVVLLCAAEAYGVLQRCGFRPATLLGLTTTGGLMFAAYWRGEPAVPLVLALAFAATMVWYLLGIVEARPLANVAVTSMTMLWVGLLGSFSALLLRVPNGKGLFLGAVVVTVASDVVAYFVGRQVGHRPLAPNVSPGKTVEGLVAGVVAAIVVGAIIGREVTPWGGIRHGLLLGVAVAIFAPVGDLFESLIKRDLDVKDSGTTLGGHGGLLDRFDSLLLVLPAVYYVADYLHLVR